jgi:hypothetical protein
MHKYGPKQNKKVFIGYNKVFYTLGGHFIVTAGHCLKSIITRQPGNKPTLCP